jgi:DNA topoisomerase-6 subunit B
VFLRRRERAKSEFRRRNIFELYIEEVVESCARLKGGKLSKDKLRAQLEKIAAKRTGGEKTDAILDRSGPEGLPHSIIVTAEGTEGEAPVLPGAEPAAVAPAEEPQAVAEEPARRRPRAKGKAKAKARKPARNKAKPAKAPRAKMKKRKK